MEIETTIQKYKKPYTPGEIRSKEYERRIKQQKRLNERLDLTDTLFNEVTFPLHQYQKNQIKDLVRKHSKNFKKLHGNASQETIIVAFIFYIKKQEEKTDIKIQRYRLARKYKLTHNTFETIICRLIKLTLEELYLLPSENIYYDNNIHYKGEIHD